MTGVHIRRLVFPTASFGRVVRCIGVQDGYGEGLKAYADYSYKVHALEGSSLYYSYRLARRHSEITTSQGHLFFRLLTAARHGPARDRVSPAKPDTQS